MTEEDQVNAYVSKERLWAKVGCCPLQVHDNADILAVGVGRMSTEWFALFRRHHILGMGIRYLLSGYESRPLHA